MLYFDWRLRASRQTPAGCPCLQWRTRDLKSLIQKLNPNSHTHTHTHTNTKYEKVHLYTLLLAKPVLVFLPNRKQNSADRFSRDEYQIIFQYPDTLA